MKKCNLILALLCIIIAPPLSAATGNNYKEKIKAAFEATDESRFQESTDLLLSLLDEIPADSLQDLSDVYGTLVDNYLRLGNVDKALQYGRRCLEVDEQSGNEENISSSLNNLAAVCLNAGRLDEAESFLYRSLTIETKLGRNDKLAIRNGMLSELYTQQGRLEEALKRAQMALDLDRADGREQKVAVRLSQLGNTLMTMCRFSEASPVLEEAAELHRKYQNLPSLALTLISLGQNNRALFNLKEAEQELNECIDIAKQIGYRQAQLAAYMELARMFNTARDPRAFDYLYKYMNLKDTLSSEQIQQQVSDLKVQYETQEKEQEIALQEVTIGRQRLLYIGLGILLLLAVVALFFVFHTLRLKEQNMELKDRFIQLISHDLKNPAIAQQRNLHALLKCHSALEPDDMKEQLNEMAQAADVQVGLLYDLLDWAGLQTGRLKYDPIKLDLLSLTEKAVEQHRAQGNLKGISISLTSEGVEHLVNADRQMVGTILRNILNNAIKYSPINGKIEVLVQDRSVIIKDHGIGFDTSKLEQQLGTAGEQGTSLGLGLARKMAQINHSKLEITSEKGVGTTVKLTFYSK